MKRRPIVLRSDVPTLQEVLGIIAFPRPVSDSVIRVLVFLLENSGRMFSRYEIAERVGLGLYTVSKALHFLARLRLVKSRIVRCRNGGYITLYWVDLDELVRRFEELLDEVYRRCKLFVEERLKRLSAGSQGDEVCSLRW